MITEISSRKNQIVKDAASLGSSASERNKQHCFLIEGARLVGDAFSSGYSVKKLFFTEKAENKYGSYIKDFISAKTQAYRISEPVAELISTTKNSQGVFAVCGMPKTEDKLNGRAVVLENIQDPQNMGTILRTAEAMGISSVVLTGDCCDVFSPKVLRGSMGAVFRLNFVLSSDAEDTINRLHGDNYTVYATVPDSSAENITKLTFTEKDAAVIGNEGNGITESMKQLSDKLVTIPMPGRAESLNAATAASIVMWEMSRQDNIYGERMANHGKK